MKNQRPRDSFWFLLIMTIVNWCGKVTLALIIGFFALDVARVLAGKNTHITFVIDLKYALPAAISAAVLWDRRHALREKARQRKDRSKKDSNAK